MKLLLIPGYGTGVQKPKVISRGLKKSFTGFQLQIDSNQAAIFSWNKPIALNLRKFLNPFEHYRIYSSEKGQIYKTELFGQLKKILTHQTPEILVCHSLGCLLLAKYCEVNTLPSSVKKVVFVQADLPQDYKLPRRLVVKNYYCPWDPTLLISAFLHGYIPAGSLGLRGSINKLFPLYTHINLHISSINNKRFSEEVLR